MKQIKVKTYNLYKPFIMAEFTKEELQPLVDVVKEIKLNNLQEYNSKLAGNIEHEYDLYNNQNLVNHITALYNPLIHYHNDKIKYEETLAPNSTNSTLRVNSLWVNFQQKYEFNPLHNHSGVFSFVIWLQVPYSIEDEMKRIPSKQSNINVPGHFFFCYPGSNNASNMQLDWLPVDKTWEYKTALFPSTLLHGVNPFYTSDEYRISVSGNFVYDIHNSLGSNP
jgi:hypothetical protein